MKNRKFNKTREWLYNEYINKNRGREEIAKECGLTIAGLKCILSRYNIKKEVKERPIANIKKLLLEGKTTKEISEILNCSRNTVYRVMKSENLHINYTPNYNNYDDSQDNLICSLYLDGYSTVEIAKAIGKTFTSVLNHLRHCNIPIRNYTECQFVANNKELPKDLYSYEYMYNLYITQRKNKIEIGKLFNVDPSTVNAALRKLKIPIRGNSEAKIGINTGAQHHNWKGGITALHLRLREAFYVQLTPIVLKRDNYTCQLCGSKKKLNVHHIVHFKTILEAIIAENPELSPIDNINELYEIAVKDKRFLDINNLITYCQYCHYNIAHKKK